MGCCEITGYMWGQGEALEWAATRLQNLFGDSVRRWNGLLLDYGIYVGPGLGAGMCCYEITEFMFGQCEELEWAAVRLQDLCGDSVRRWIGLL